MTDHAATTAWGTTIAAEGVTFRLWAPARESVSVVVEGRPALAMKGQDGGWFELHTDAVRPGMPYMFGFPDGLRVPDPAARAQMSDVHGASRLVDPRAFAWTCDAWPGRSWQEAVIYELHVGTFTPNGTFDGVINKLDHLADIGITAIELMPVGQFSGSRGWGYDGVLLYAPHAAYGGPEGLKRLVDAAHHRGVMVILDVVYNHFGPDGNYLPLYAPSFFDTARQTPWGAAISYRQRAVRQFVVENAIYWLEEYQIDGLRLDAINQIQDPSSEDLLVELAGQVRSRFASRHVHLTTEDDRNLVSLHPWETNTAKLFTAEWNDDVHHAMHVMATGETEGYYADYVQPTEKLARALAEGFVYQGEASPYLGGHARGEISSHQPSVAFIDFLQNHDQIGNRAFGERLTTLAPAGMVELLMATLLLSPHIPLLFMGEEFGETKPFCFFTDFQGELAALVREGRRNEFKRWRAFEDPEQRDKIPDPNALSTFESCVLDWRLSDAQKRRQQLVQRLLRLRFEAIVPRLSSLTAGRAKRRMLGDHAFEISWPYSSAEELLLRANYGSEAVQCTGATMDENLIYESSRGVTEEMRKGSLAGHRICFAWRRGDAAKSA
jgi:maltooligosyltrehalose trehalohydrolase